MSQNVTFEVNSSTREQRDLIRSFLETEGGAWERLSLGYWNFTCKQEDVDRLEELFEKIGLLEDQYKLV